MPASTPALKIERKLNPTLTLTFADSVTLSSRPSSFICSVPSSTLDGRVENVFEYDGYVRSAIGTMSPETSFSGPFSFALGELPSTSAPEIRVAFDAPVRVDL